MILVIGGTSEGREIARIISQKGLPVLVSTATGYGKALASADGVKTAQGRMDLDQMADFITENSIRVVIDASHPFAAEVSRNASGACHKAGIPCIRYARPGLFISERPGVYWAGDFYEAAGRACDLGQNIFLATGAKTAGIFTDAAREKSCRIIVRVIPDPDTIKSVMGMGVSPSDVVAVQGPFSVEMNAAMWRHCRADVVVTKESGRAGGLEEKITAAERLGIPIIIVRRPPEPPDAAGTVDEAVERALEACFNHREHREKQ